MMFKHVIHFVIQWEQQNNNLADRYKTASATWIDKQAPVCTKHITQRLHAPWHSDELRTAKYDCQKAERL